MSGLLPNLPDGLELDNVTRDGTRTCVETLANAFVITSIIISILVLVLYAFATRRVRLWPKACNGAPGLVIPLNMVHSTPHQTAYVLAFGAIAGDILSYFFNDTFLSDVAESIAGAGPAWIVILVLQAVIYFPVFASVDAPIPLLGYAIGGLYTSWLFGQRVVIVVQTGAECYEDESIITQEELIVLVAAVWPILLCQVVLSAWFLYKFCSEVIRLCRSPLRFEQAVMERQHSHYHINRVKRLLRKPVPREHKRVTNILIRWFNYFYTFDTHIQYPVRFLAAVIVMSVLLYMVTLLLAYNTFDIFLNVVNRLNSARFREDVLELGEMISNSEILRGTNATSAVDTAYKIARDAAYGFVVIFPAAPLIAFLINLVLLVHMVMNVHMNLTCITRGDFSFLPSKIPSPAYRLLHSMRYASYQIAYFLWSWILLVLIVWVLGLLLLLLYFAVAYFPTTTYQIAIAVILPLLYSFFLYYVQLISCKLFFVGDTNNKHTVLKNAHLFHWFTYVLFFHNLLVGLTSALLRILYSLGFGMLLFFRLDKSVLMRGFERFDPGHKTYIGFLYLEHTQNNSVLNVFVRLLLESVASKKAEALEARPVHSHSVTEQETIGLQETHVEEGISSPSRRDCHMSRQAVNRWLVAYTLLRNPTLQPLTGARLATGKKGRKRRVEERSTEVEGQVDSVGRNGEREEVGEGEGEREEEEEGEGTRKEEGEEEREGDAEGEVEVVTVEEIEEEEGDEKGEVETGFSGDIGQSLQDSEELGTKEDGPQDVENKCT